ncbi:hypothetical protein EV379_2198 [Microterricola gilva]|uniref:Uncharacterized protein n=1 Tax=Microterricola gilva TaxID=393267 RepID=A0A4Q8AMN4_9MICO|nr:hypothetical protein [Microterricola gilva]RZU65860.1 hypothetical protein EV379_2198 [Microterricola gilva]
MNDDNELDPLARLRAADPASGVTPRAGFEDDVVARAMADQPAGASAETAANETQADAAVTDLSAERARRRPRWLPIAAVAASLAIVGSAGYGIGASAGGGTSTIADGAAPPISLQSGAGLGTPAPDGGAGQGSSGAVETQSKMSANATPDTMFPGFGRNVFSSSGLSTAAGSAAAYTYDARAASNAESVAALGAALGIEGTPVLKDGSWQLGPQDGTAPYLSVGLDGTLGFYFNDPLINPWQCADAAESCAPPADLPGADAAIDALRSLITSVGRDPASFEYTSETWEGSFTRPAQAWPVVNGQRLDQSWNLELTSSGVVNASGSLADIVALGDYPIVSEQEAFERLSDPRFGAQMTAMPIAFRGPQAATSTEWVPPTEPPATPGAGTTVSWPVNEVEIVSARLGLSSQWQPDGSVLVVPAYEFTDADGGTWSVIAVADSMLDFASE